MNPLEALMMPQDDERLRALAESLRGRQVAADFFSGSSLPNLQRMAQAEQKYIQDTAERQGVLREALEKRKQRSDEFRQRQELLERQQDELGQYREALLASRTGEGFDPSAPGTTKNIGRFVDTEGNERIIGFREGVPVDLSTQQPITAEEMQVLRPQTPLSEAAEVQAFEDLGKRTKDINTLVSQIEALDTRLEPYAEAGTPISKVPGFGFFEKMPVVGGPARAFQDLISSEGAQGKNFAAMKSVMNTIARLRAGLAQTGIELENIRAESGMDALSDPRVFASYYDRLKDSLEADLADIEATTSPRLLKEYGKRTGGGRDVFAHQFRRFEFPDQPTFGEEVKSWIPWLPDEEEGEDGWQIEEVK